MTRLRPPVVAGVGGGVGTTTLAVALRGVDAGRAGGPADIVACRGTLESVRRAAALLDRTGPGPVLAVTLDGARARGPLRVHLDKLPGHVVLLPHVGRWRTLPDPFSEVAGLLVEPVDRLPRPLRAYTAALRELVAAIAASGRLRTGPPPEPRRPADAPPGPPPPAGPPRSGSAGLAAPRIISSFRPVGGAGAGRPSAAWAPPPVAEARPGGGAGPDGVSAARGPADPTAEEARPVEAPTRGIRVVAPPTRRAPVRAVPAGEEPGRQPLAGRPDLRIERAG